MNRAERRRMGRESATADPIITMRRSELERLKYSIADKAAAQTFLLMLSIPATIIHRNFAELMRREGREERFVDLCLQMYERFEMGVIKLEDVRDQFERETGIKIREDRPCG